MKRNLLVVAIGVLTALPTSGAMMAGDAVNDVKDCIAALTGASLSSWATTTLAGAGTHDGFAVWASPNVEIAYFDYQSHTTDANGNVVSVSYVVTGITRQISCGLNSVCPTIPDVELVLDWTARVREAIEQGNTNLPVPSVCELT